MDLANCLDYDPDTWFPTATGPHNGVAAERVCRECPVTRECEDFRRRTNSVSGVWGGVAHGAKNASASWGGPHRHKKVGG